MDGLDARQSKDCSVDTLAILNPDMRDRVVAACVDLVKSPLVIVRITLSDTDNTHGTPRGGAPQRASAGAGASGDAAASLFLEQVANNLQAIFGEGRVILLASEIALILVENSIARVRSRLNRLFADDSDTFAWVGVERPKNPHVGYAYGVPRSHAELEAMFELAGAQLERSRRDGEPLICGKKFEGAPSFGDAAKARRYEDGRDVRTGLLDMDGFNASASYFIGLSDVRSQGLACVYFGIENLGSYCERNGFEAGEKLLGEIASAIEDEFFGFVVARTSRAHFCVLCSARDALARAEEVCGVVDRRSPKSETRAVLKAGVYNLGADDPEEVASCCEKARCAYGSIAKRLDCPCAVYEEGMRRAAERRQNIIDSLDHAIASQDIVPYYQPIVRSVTGEVFAVEVLARWNDSRLGTIDPDQFVPVCEEARLIHLLDAHIIRTACRDWRRLSEQAHTQISLSINMSRLDSQLCDIVDVIDCAVVENHIPRGLVDIEVTESSLTNAPDELRDAIASLKSKGYRIWMDDYGSGYSSLEALRTYDFDALKLDKTFILGADSDPRSEIITASSIGMAKQLGLQTICEGVETQASADFLREAGCDFQQGFLYARPMSFDELKGKVVSGELAVEDPAQHGYRDAASRVNTLSPEPFAHYDATAATQCNEQVPLAIIERDAAGDFHFMTCNGSFVNVIGLMGFATLDDLASAAKEDDFPLTKYVNALFDPHGQFERAESFDFVYQGSRYACKVRRLAANEGSVEALVSIEPLESLGDLAYAQGGILAEQLTLSLESVYNQIYLCDVKKGTVTLAFRNETSFDQLFQGTVSLEDAIGRMRERVHPALRERFAEFMDFSTLGQRLGNDGRRHVAESFTMMNAQGTYSWQSITLIPAVIELRESVVICLRDTNMDVVREVTTPGGVISSGQLWEALSEGCGRSVFWKGADGRFIGANQMMMDSCGMTSLSDFVGKTDKDIGWLVSPDSFEEAEREVIERGKEMHGMRCSCVVSGRVRAMEIDEVPVRDEAGRVVGLCGWLRPADEQVAAAAGAAGGAGVSAAAGVMGAAGAMGAAGEAGVSAQAGPSSRAWASLDSSEIDAETGCLNARGLARDGSLYCSEAAKAGMDAALVEIEIANADRLEDVYGGPFVRRAVNRVASVLLDSYGTSCLVARIANNRFCVCSRLEGSDAADELDGCIRAQVEGITAVDSTPVSLEVLTAHALWSEARGFSDLVSKADSLLDKARLDAASVSGSEIESLTTDSLLRSMRLLNKAFDLVRLVDPSATEARELSYEADCLEAPYCCYSSWHRSERCVNCISAKAVSRRKPQVKYEIRDGKVFYVASQPVVVDGSVRALEIGVSFDSDQTEQPTSSLRLVGCESKGEAPKYHDQTTGVYNRLFYDEEVSSLVASKAVLVNVDHFKAVNEEYGFDEGNRVLSKVAWTLARHARPRDLIIRYAADEFLIVFDTNMPSDVFEERLGQLRSSIRHLSFKELPDLRLTISIGAVDSAGFVADLMARAREQLRQAQQTGDAISLYTGSLASPASTASPASPEEVRL